MRLRILIFEDAISLKRPEEEGQVIIEGRVTAEDFARAVQKVAQENLGYPWRRRNEAWTGQRGFPLRGLKALDAALSQEEPLPKAERLKH